MKAASFHCLGTNCYLLCFRFHKSCAERAAEISGYFFKCPLCNNKDIFEHEMKRFGVKKTCLRAFINDVTQIWRFFTPPLTLSHSKVIFTCNLMHSATKVLTALWAPPCVTSFMNFPSGNIYVTPGLSFSNKFAQRKLFRTTF